MNSRKKSTGQKKCPYSSKRLLSLVLTLVMLLSLMPTMAFAGNEESAIQARTPVPPSSISVVCESDHVIDGKLVAKQGDSFTFRALDQDGKETPVTWSTSTSTSTITLDENGMMDVTATLSTGGTSYVYITATSTLDNTVSKQQSFQLTGYQFSPYNQNKTVALSADGQSVKTDSLSGGYAGHTSWTNSGMEGLAVCTKDPETGTSYSFTALRPGVFTVTTALDVDATMTDTATVTITGVAVEDATGAQGKTYLTITDEDVAPTAPLRAYCAQDRTIATWTSANEAVATVSDAGLITAVGIGSTLITVTDSEGTKGGIKVVVQSGETPYFEALEFATTSLTSGAWVANQTFHPTKLDYELPLKTYSVSSLMLQATTLYDNEQFTATAEYVDVNGEKQSVEIKSGAATTLANQPFDNSTLTVTLASKANESLKTVYTFHVSRPRDTTKTIKANGAVLVPDGRSLSLTKYDGYAEGTMLKADENGDPTSGTGVAAATYYYHSYAMSDLEAFSLSFTGNTVYTHLRYSADNGETWTELPQGGGNTKKFNFTENIVKVQVQILDDQSYVDNIAAGKEGFAEGEMTTYAVWVERIGAGESNALITEADAQGDWYPAFVSDLYTYSIVVPNGTTTGTLTYKVADGATVKLGSAVQEPGEGGTYTLTLKTSNQTLTVTSADGMFSNNYVFKLQAKSKYAVPDRVTDYLCMGSQYTNGSFGQYPDATLAGTLKSLGNFGGYITYYYDTPLIDDPRNAYGVDFYVYGNAFADGGSAGELGQVYVSEDGQSWYALAGSEHYESKAIWDYTITYTKSETGLSYWTDNQGNVMGNAAKAWPSRNYYPLNNVSEQGSYSFTGIVFESQQGSIMGDSSTTSYAAAASFGYADYFANGTVGVDVDPYMENPTKNNGFDLAWAVDAAGNPIDVSDKQFHYVKVATASNIWAGAFNEKSTEVTYVMRTTAQQENVGVTDALTGVTISDGANSRVFNFTDDQQIYNLDVGEMKYVSISVNGADTADNIYIGNQRVADDGKATGFKVTEENGETLVRVIVQNGEKAPMLYLLKLTGTAKESDDLIENIRVNVGGEVRTANTSNGIDYTLSVGYRMETLSSIVPVVDTDVSYTINGQPAAADYVLSYGDNRFVIEATGPENRTQTVTLTIKRSDAPTQSGNTIFVYFSLLGDSVHGAGGTVHTYKNNASELESWIPRTRYTLPVGSTVLDLFEIALKDYHLTWVNAGGNYISEINGLSEFSNGPLSGWMYTRNGSYPNYGVAEQTLSYADAIVFHYTDDYTQEESVIASSSGGATSSVPTSTIIKPGATLSGSTATAAVTTAMIDPAIDVVKKSGETVITIMPTGTESAKTINVTLPKAAAQSIVSDTAAALNIETNSGSISVSNAALKSIVSQANGNVQFSITQGSAADVSNAGINDANAVAVEVGIHSDNKAITSLTDSALTVSIPVDSSFTQGQSYRVIAISADGSKETVYGKCVKVDGKLEIQVSTPYLGTFIITHNTELAFADVNGHWAMNAITYALDNGLMNGVGGSMFAPEETLNRAMLVTILYRLEGEPAVNAENPFTDVSAGQWYTNSIIWAKENKIVDGYSNSMFGPLNDITREQMAKILLSYSQYKKYDVAKINDLSGYIDADDVSAWAMDAIKWANAESLINGRTANTIVPGGNATRAEAATILMRYIENFVK